MEHILTGFDHLLFVLGLVLLSPEPAPALLGHHGLHGGSQPHARGGDAGFRARPAAAVEAVIALSIVFVAAEIIHARHGRVGLAARAPWLVAFAFGLLHGFGFAGALSEIGMPQGYIPAALLFFNLGVEAGQLAFVAVVLVTAAGLRRIWRPLPALGAAGAIHT